MQKTIPPDRWPARGEPLVIGISGGPDSTALVFLLDELNTAQDRGWRLHLAHLNHGLRGTDSDSDAGFVADLAERHDWEVTIDQRPVRERAKQSGGTLEETARNERYDFFERVLMDHNARVIATAHHADDNVETVLHRLIRGTGIRGLSGIPAMRPLRNGQPYRLIRPLLNVRRADILAYLDRRGITYCHDHTNEVTEFTRNRIRNELIPKLEQDYNPAVADALLRLAEQARRLNEFVQRAVDEKFPMMLIGEKHAEHPTEITLNATALLREPQALQTELIRRAIAKLGVGEKKLTFGHLRSIVELAQKNVSGKRLELPGGLTVEYDRKTLRLGSVRKHPRSRRL
ncbi:MAG: tRNA lysidine(34) synthetase TilS [Planctomycetes bacterium]|nr:tRNA lysidine(34) synthetase TilS [Planctomycetota bacterium]